MDNNDLLKAIDVFGKTNQVLLASLIEELERAGLLNQAQVQALYVAAIDRAKTLRQMAHEAGDADDEEAYAGAAAFLSVLSSVRP